MIASPRFRMTVAALTLALGAGAASAAGLTLNVANKQANSVQTFSTFAQSQFRQVGVTFTALGNATAVANVKGAYNLPITTITIGSNLKVASGAAVGSALQLDRIGEDEETGEEVAVTLTLANFKIDYTRNLVLADATPKGGTTIPQMPLYSFTVNEALKLKYVFPLTITGHEELSKLFLTPEAKSLFISALKLPSFVIPLLDTTDFGTIVNDISTKSRSPAVPTAPYVAN
ncbi:hypothetical protein [uncultured Aquabacterium sp.]|uniref:hypothetical protein n=1 Tax=uncultured Aquabacterium sp. TaxID=158753 RepID=UPI0025CE4543|nr:hypothetical protein [uncultured Aquabacterium sp.]